jgi:hypothetical protein
MNVVEIFDALFSLQEQIEALKKRVQELEDAAWRNGWESK